MATSLREISFRQIREPLGSQRTFSTGLFSFFFLISGFCSMLYEIVWLRLAMEAFGITTALTSIVLSVFMAGLGLGSWASGRILRECQSGLRMSVLIYAAIEAVIGFSALLVPIELYWGHMLTERQALASSLSFYVLSGLCIAVALLPWCACMGATLPVGMQAIRSAQVESERSFSYLYVANLSGALLGSLVPLFLIELRGFRGTLKIGAISNFSLALTAILLAFRNHSKIGGPRAKRDLEPLMQRLESPTPPQGYILVLLFGTGLTCMGMEVVWIRQFTPFVGSMVYSFALILGVYLCATKVGAHIYRRWSVDHSHEPPWMWALLGLCGLLPLLTTNPLLHWWPQAPGGYAEPALEPLLRLFVGIGPFSALLGFVTPMLVDRWSRGNADRAGTAYAVNILGCIVGPLLSGFLLLPRMNEQFTIFLFALPWFGIGLGATFKRRRRAATPAWSYAIVLAAVPLMVSSHSYEDLYPVRQVLRDHTATVVAAKSNYGRNLFVNGIGMTSMTSITKMMAHLPMASLDRPPQNALVICFGMGTTFRSLLSWSVPVTAVELVPSVPRVFGFFYKDGPALLQSANAHVVIDDGRRYLERTTEQYDVITIDPPPPVPAAGSSLLYARELYVIARKRLRSGGILAQWFPDDKNAMVLASVSRALRDVFPFVRAFPSIDGSGVHFLASNQPISRSTPEELVSRMPRTAMADLVEWQKKKDPADPFASVVEHELSVDSLITNIPHAPMLDDDHPINEFFLLRCLNLSQRDNSRMGCGTRR